MQCVKKKETKSVCERERGPMVVFLTRQILANGSIAMVFWLKGFFSSSTFLLFVCIYKRAQEKM